MNKNIAIVNKPVKLFQKYHLIKILIQEDTFSGYECFILRGPFNKSLEKDRKTNYLV